MTAKVSSHLGLCRVVPAPWATLEASPGACTVCTRAPATDSVQNTAEHWPGGWNLQVSLKEILVLKFPHKTGPGKFLALGLSVCCNNFTWDTVETFSRILQPESVRARVALRCQQDFSAKERSSQKRKGFSRSNCTPGTDVQRYKFYKWHTWD